MGIVLTADGVAEATAPMLVGYLRDRTGSYDAGFVVLVGDGAGRRRRDRCCCRDATRVGQSHRLSRRRRLPIDMRIIDAQSHRLQSRAQLRHAEARRPKTACYGLGDATLNGRELAVASYLRDHVVPLLIGRDARRIEDIWQYLYKGAYWRRGPVTMTAIAAVDTALWDIMGKTLNTPVYQLLGGASRDVGHGLRPRQRRRRRRDGAGRAAVRRRWATRRCARSAAFPASSHAVRRRPRHAVLRAGAERPAARERLEHRTLPRLRAAAVRAPSRASSATTCTCCTTCTTGCTPIEAARLGKRLEPYRLFWLEDPVPAEIQDALPHDPPAHDHADRGRRGVQHDLRLPAADRGTADRLHPHDGGPRRRASPICGRSRRSPSSITCAPARTARPICVRWRWPRRCISTSACTTSVFRSTCATRTETDAVFPHAYTFDGRHDASGRRPGLGVDIDEELAATYPYDPAYLPVNRKLDGTVHSW